MTSLVWVADDNSAFAESLVLMLDLSGIPAVALASGSQVRKHLDAGEEPAVLIMDLLMPMNGTTVLEYLVSNPQWRFPVIVLSGYSDDLDLVLAARADQILSKTVEPKELIACVRAAIKE